MGEELDTYIVDDMLTYPDQCITSPEGDKSVDKCQANKQEGYNSESSNTRRGVKI